ncbi:hypothetical protein C9426_24130 [Serratia sp. S1B]|nr:hypothetical protein C9426_24130 [Serratia sp. S1B]
MKKLKAKVSAIVLSTISLFPVLTFAAQPVIDVDSLNELKQIHATIHSALDNNKQKNYTCTDGEKSYTAGMDVTRNGIKYKCEVKGDHVEWVSIPHVG